MYSKLVCVGGLIQDPSFSERGDKVVTSFVLALNGFNDDDTVFLDVECWGKIATICNERLSKGSRILMEGTLRCNRWVGKDGKKRADIYCTASTVKFLDKKNTEEDGPPVTKRPSTREEPDAVPASVEEDSEFDQFIF